MRHCIETLTIDNDIMIASEAIARHIVSPVRENQCPAKKTQRKIE